MPVELVITGKDIVVNEADLTLLFQLGATTSVDWVAAGYFMKFKYIAPSGTPTTKTLTAVVGDVYSGQLEGTDDCFTESGTYRGVIYFTDGSEPVNIASINFTFEVYPSIV